MEMKLNKDTVILLASTLIIALCGLLYELLIGSASSYLLGSSVKQFSFTIGTFMTSFGVGSFLSKYFRKHILKTFFIVETIIGFLGSISILALFYFYSISDLYHIVMYFFIISIGTLVGLEIPLIGRIIDEIKKDIRVTLANLLSFDYIGAMIGSILLPLVFLPKLGLIKTSIVIGIGNLFVSVLVGFRFRKDLSKTLLAIPLLLIVFDVVFIIKADKIQTYIEQKFYDDKIIFRKRSKYQKIIVTKDGNDIRLFLDGNIQFSSVDEYRYHETLVHVSVASRGLKNLRNVLVLGGGDGLVARELLKYPQIKNIVICDLDPDIVTIFKNHKLLRKLNNNAFLDTRVKVVNKDAFQFLHNSIKRSQNVRFNRKWDLIIIDLPDPNNESLAKLYSVKFYKLVMRNLSRNGIAVTQAVSPFHARNVFWCIKKTIKEAGFNSILPYNVNVPSFGVWGFIAFSMNSINLPNKIHIDNGKLKFINSQILPTFFKFPQDMSEVRTEVNKLFRPVILDYYEKSWRFY